MSLSLPMYTHVLPGLPELDVERLPRDWLPEAAKLVAALEGAMISGDVDEAQVDALAFEMGAPALDLVPTALTYRAALMGAGEGRAFYHHELRRRLAMPEGLEPEVRVWQAGTTPVWSDGVLAEPKYFSFFQDAPFPAYNPNHRRKWRAHELLHGASKFFWHPEMTRFEFYVSARLNELVPIIHWYHLDEIFRPRCDQHEDQVLHREHCLACQEAVRPFWACGDVLMEERRARARMFVESAWGHFEEEWAAIGKEMESGRPVEVARAHLNASSDAVGYMRAHWNRVTAWSFGTWAELFLVDGVDYYGELEGLYENVGRTMQRLVGGEESVTTEAYLARRTRCQLQDMGYRAMLALEHLDPESNEGRRAEEMMMPALESAAGLAGQLMAEPGRYSEGLDEFARVCKTFSTIAHLFPEEVADGFLGFGYRFIDPQVFSMAAVGQVLSGLEEGMPATVQSLVQPVEMIQAFAGSAHFDAPKRLAGRFAEWLGGQGGEAGWGTQDSAVFLEMARFEAMVNAEPRQDEEATNFAVLPEYASDVKNHKGVLRAHETLRRGWFSREMLEEVMGAELEGGDGDVPVAVILVEGAPRVVVEDEETGRILDAVCGGEPVGTWWEFTLGEALMTLLENRMLVWLPAPMRG